MLKDIIHYEQNYSVDGHDIPRNYYDPNIMLAERQFHLSPNEEILIIINGSGYRFSDDTIFTIEIPKMNEIINDINSDITEKNNQNEVSKKSDNLSKIIPSSFSSKQLCLYVKNLSNSYSFYVGYKSSLARLLDMPRIFSKLCYCNVNDLTQFKLEFNFLNNESNNDSSFKVDSGAICIR
jgi:hypothetical protein